MILLARLISPSIPMRDFYRPNVGCGQYFAILLSLAHSIFFLTRALPLIRINFYGQVDDAAIL